MSNWHFQLMKHVDKCGDVWYGVHEAYPTVGEGLHIEEPVTVQGESIEAVKWQLEAILRDIARHGVIDYEL